MHENLQLITDHVSPDIFQIFNIKLDLEFKKVSSREKNFSSDL